jgi:hypothetical protein
MTFFKRSAIHAPSNISSKTAWRDPFYEKFGGAVNSYYIA